MSSYSEMLRQASLTYTGTEIIGAHNVLSLQEEDLLSGYDFFNAGYKVTPLLVEREFELLKSEFTGLMINTIKKNGIDLPPDFCLENYHRYVLSDEQHLANAKWQLLVEDFNECALMVQKRVSEFLQKNLRFKKLTTEDGTEKEILGYRIIRPKRNDSTPFHRDAWLNIWKGTLTVWIPIAGCDNQSTLAVLPGSHLWPESELSRTEPNCVINGKQHKVPALIGTRCPYEIYYPNPGYGEALIFTPYLIHGGGENNNTNTTRFSLEFRFQQA